jgi:hypothetical protein
MKLTQTITIAFLTVPSVCFAWISNTAPNVHHRSRVLFMSDEQLSDLPGTGLIESDNPCWEDIYDTDCAMENIFAARFKASEWIKSMPCAEGIEVSSQRFSNQTLPLCPMIMIAVLNVGNSTCFIL